MSQSNHQFRSALNERHADVRKAADECVARSSVQSLQQNAATVAEFQAACEHLDAILAKADKPSWLTVGIKTARTFAGNKNAHSGGAFYKWLHQNGGLIRKSIEPGEASEVQFDKLYSELRDQAGIPGYSTKWSTPSVESSH